MAFWDKIRNKDIKKKEEGTATDTAEEMAYEAGEKPEEVTVEKGNYNLKVREERNRFIRNNCDIITESNRQIEETKVEYDQVTSYLTDIQKIDRIHGEERESLQLTCTHLIQLERERAQFKNANTKITEVQMHRLEPYSDTLAEEVKKMYANEAYRTAVKNDMKHLEAEKAGLFYEKEEIIEKQSDLKAISKVLVVLFVSLCVLFFVIYYGAKTDMTLPYMATLVLAAAAAAVIVNESRKNAIEMKIIGLKLNKAIGLLNSVKIKYINNANVLDYTCAKYGVNSAAEFEFLYNEYCAAKEFERRVTRNTELIHRNQESLLQMLSEAQVQDTEVWLHQLAAIVDEREMVEVRHRLNVRRRSLRDRVTFNKENKDHAFRQIAMILEKYPNAKGDILQILKEYQISSR